jgi:murein DD-endopeptidase MepM/ murein hydrolase activator NlpD
MPTPNEVEALIRRVAGTYTFSDPDLLVATAKTESSLNPFAVGDQGQSYGVFQEHSKGRGAGVPVPSRQDVEAATQRAIREFNAIRTKNPTVDRGTWAALAQRPLDAAGYARSVNAMLGAAGGVADGGLRPQGAPPVSLPTAGADAPAWYQKLVGSGGTSGPAPAAPATAASAGQATGADPNAPAWYQKLVGGGLHPRGASSGGVEGGPVAGPVITKSGQPYWSFGGGAHAGIDIEAKAGTPVRSPVAGEVVANLAAGQNPIGLSKGYGRGVAVRDAQGDIHVFGHGAPDFDYLPVGTRVGVGDIISVVGSPKTKLPGEASEGEHLHWEIRGGGDYGKQIDPEAWLSQRRVPATDDPRQALAGTTGLGVRRETGDAPTWYRKLMAA